MSRRGRPNPATVPLPIRYSRCERLVSVPVDLHRRDMLRAALSVAVCPLLHACAEGAPPTAPALEVADDAATVRGNVVEIDVTRVPQWREMSADASAVVFLAAQVIVVRQRPESFTAFSAVCPHAGCGVSTVRASELLCPCHGSTFSFRGERLAGPAPTGLSALPVTYDAASRRLTIQRPGG